jgi:hypothetical protein
MIKATCDSPYAAVVVFVLKFAELAFIPCFLINRPYLLISQNVSVDLKVLPLRRNL